MKKLAALLLALVMVLALAACAGTPAEKPTDTKAPATEKNADTTAPATEPAPTGYTPQNFGQVGPDPGDDLPF